MSNKSLFLEKLQSRAAVPGFTLPEETVCLKIQNKPIGSLENIVCFQGAPKQGKSLFITSCIASAFVPFPIFDMKLNRPAGRDKICYVDTESSAYDFYRVLDRIKIQTLRSSLPDTIQAFNFREDSPADIMQMIEVYLENNKDCAILCIDGILDLIADFNSVEQSFFLINWLKRITKQFNILLLCVLHLSKKEGNSLGHIGSFLDRKSQSVFKVQKNKKEGTIDLESTFLRSTGDIDTISVMYQSGSWVQVNNDQTKPAEHPDNDFIKSNFEQEKSYKDAVAIIAKYINRSETSAKAKLKFWIDTGRVIKTSTGYKKAGE